MLPSSSIGLCWNTTSALSAKECAFLDLDRAALRSGGSPLSQLSVQVLLLQGWLFYDWYRESSTGRHYHLHITQSIFIQYRDGVQGLIKVTYNTGNPIFKYEKFELLVCIYEISRALVFKYGISGCSRCLTLVTTVNPIPFQVQMRYLFPIQLNHVSPCKYQFTRSLWKVRLFCNAVHLGWDRIHYGYQCRTSWASRNPIFEYQLSGNLINAYQELNFFIFKCQVSDIISAFY